MMKEDIVIIVPTKGRQNYLNRVASYYSNFDMHTYICDAYQTRCEIDNYETIHYLWDPSKGFFEEMLDVIKNTNAQYYLLSPDDDFIRYETCIECYEEMEKDKTVVIGSGKQLFFSEDYKGNFVFYNAHNKLARLKKQKFDKDDYKQFWHGYQNIHWSIFRRDFLIMVLEKLMRIKYGNANFTELTMGIEALLNGKVYISKNYFNYREESSKPHWGTIANVPNWRNFLFSSELHSDLRKMKGIYNIDWSFVIRSLYYFLGNPLTKIKDRLLHFVTPSSQKLELGEVISDKVMDRRIREALEKMN